MPSKSLKIDSLDLDLQNPRITMATDQRDAMQKILKEQKVRLINLAESIAARGLSPMDRLLVLRSPKQGRFVVIEGNRRVLALKLLKNSALVEDLVMPEAFKKRLQKASTNFNIDSVEPVDCFEVRDREQGNEWIRQRHIGEDSGRGTVDWSAVASSRFRGRDPALQALDFVLQHADLTEEQGEQINARFPLTTLARLLSTPSVRTAIGFHIEKNKLLTDLPASEALKPLRRMVLDLAEKAVNVTDLKSKVQQDEYISKLKPSDTPNLRLKTSKLAPVDAMRDKDFAASPGTVPRPPRSQRKSGRHSIIRRGVKLNITTPKIAAIYKELSVLHLTKHIHAIGVLLRVFLEMSVDEYLTTKAGSTLKNNAGYDKNLRQKVDETINHLVSLGADKKDFLGVSRAMSDQNHPFSIETLHAYIHNRFFTPVDTHLTVAWDNAEPFFSKLWP